MLYLILISYQRILSVLSVSQRDLTMYNFMKDRNCTFELLACCSLLLAVNRFVTCILY